MTGDRRQIYVNCYQFANKAVPRFYRRDWCCNRHTQDGLMQGFVRRSAADNRHDVLEAILQPCTAIA